MESHGVSFLPLVFNSLENAYSTLIQGGARKDSNRRDAVDDRLTELESKIEMTHDRMSAVLELVRQKIESENEQ